MRRGKIVRCVEAPNYLGFLFRRKEYVVCSSAGGYVTILGDDNRGHAVLHTLFVSANGDDQPTDTRSVT